MIGLKFKTRWRNEDDGWSAEGPVISDKSGLDAVRKVLERGPIIVEHSHYRGGSAPSRYVLEDWEEFENFLTTKPFAGDAIDVWSFVDICTPDRRIAGGKCPADDGKTPSGGSY